MGWAASDESYEGEDGEGEDVLPEPILGDDNLYFCTECTSEVVDGSCHQCGTEHQYPEVSHHVSIHESNINLAYIAAGRSPPGFFFYNHSGDTS